MDRITGRASGRCFATVMTFGVITDSELEMQGWGFGSSGVTRVLTRNAVPVVNNCEWTVPSQDQVERRVVRPLVLPLSRAPKEVS